MSRLTSFPSPGGEGMLSFETRHSSPGSLSNLHESLDFLRDFYKPVRLGLFYFRFNSASTAETTAEILLRFAETSQQTLRHFSLLPITYINFAEKIALKSKLLRLLRLDPKLHCHFVPFVSTFRSADSPVRPFSSFQRTLDAAVSLGHNAGTAKNTFRTRKNTRKNTRRNTLKTLKNTEKNTFFFFEPRNVNSRSACSAYPFEKIRNPILSLARSISSPGGEDQDEGVRSFDPRQTLDFPTQNAFLKLNLAAIFSLQPLALSLSPHSRSACSAYPFEKIRHTIHPLAAGLSSLALNHPDSIRAPLDNATPSLSTLNEFLCRSKQLSAQTISGASLPSYLVAWLISFNSQPAFSLIDAPLAERDISGGEYRGSEKRSQENVASAVQQEAKPRRKRRWGCVRADQRLNC
jgi:hypothetical protein